MNCVIIEDQAPAQRILQKYINDIGTFEVSAVFCSALEAKEFIDNNHVDLLFLDIHLPNISGIDFLKLLTNPPAVILTTAFTEYALQGYEFNVLDYLVKPFSYERFKQAVDKFEKQIKSIFIKTGREYIKINLSELYYIQSDMDYTEIHLKDKKHLTSETLSKWEGQLSKSHFLRVHKSYIVNLEQVEKVAGKTILLKNDQEIPIGRAYKEKFMKIFIS